MEYTAVSPAEFTASTGVDDWRVHLGSAHADFRAGSFARAAELVVTIAGLADSLAHHPDVSVLYPDRVRLSLSTHATGGLTTLDVELARAISAAARDAGAMSEPAVGQSVEVTIDAIDIEACLPFWAAVMGDYRRSGPRSLIDPLRSGPAIYFQQMDVPRPQRNRVHVDVSVPHDVAEQRVAAAVAAGGRLVSDARARAFWVLADPEGNEACVCTWQDRENPTS